MPGFRSRASHRKTQKLWRYRPFLELLERRIVFASDFGDAPLPYKTLLAEGGAEHVATGPTLGAIRDTEADGVHTSAANGDDVTRGDDEDGVRFGTIRTGSLGATATVNVQGGSAKLDGWIDFNADGSWGGPGEQIADSVAVIVGSSRISFDVPSWAADGITFARFRLSTAGNLGVGGVAVDGEVEDYALTIKPPKVACGCFGGPKELNFAADAAASAQATDIDGDGDTDVLSASSQDHKIAWYENDGNQKFTPHIISTAAHNAQTVWAADVDSDGDTDVLSASSLDNDIIWYENDSNQIFTPRFIGNSVNAVGVYATDLDGDGDTDVLSASGLDNKIAWYENDGNEAFAAHTISTAAARAKSVFALDMDGDGDIDVFSASRDDDKIAWYENDGRENFTTQIISTSADGAESVYAADVDGDGDIDVLSASRNDDKIAWYENDGGQNFSAHTINTAANGAVSVFATDVDSDGDVDSFGFRIGQSGRLVRERRRPKLQLPHNK